jgi:uncharacterized membrane protein YidH (DUF202 family)
MKKVGISIISVGMVVIAFGIIFFLQGNSLLGPKSSFMYANPKWVLTGLWIIVAGTIITFLGIWFNSRVLRNR